MKTGEMIAWGALLIVAGLSIYSYLREREPGEEEPKFQWWGLIIPMICVYYLFFMKGGKK